MLQQRLSRDHHARRADAALQPAVLQQFLLNGVQLTTLGDTFHRLHRLALHLGSQHQAGTHQPIIDQHGTRPAITGIATDLGTYELKLIAEHLGQHLPGRAQKCSALTINRGLHGHFVQRLVHERASVIRCCALAMARATSTPTT